MPVKQVAARALFHALLCSLPHALTPLALTISPPPPPLWPLVNQVAGAVLRDPSPCDALADQVVTGAAARQLGGAADATGPGAGAGWGSASGDSQDGGDGAFMARIVAERLAAVSARGVLLPRG